MLIRFIAVLIPLFAVSFCSADDTQTKLDVGAGYRYFLNDYESPFKNTSADYRSSPYAKVELEGSTSNENWLLQGRVFGSWDSSDDDSERRYYDIRQASVDFRSDTWALSFGRGIFFWGVSETINVVNTINQSDLRESTDGKIKLGQDYASLRYDWGANNLTFYYLPTFEEVHYPGRPATLIPIDTDKAFFEDGAGDGDYALRWQMNHDVGDFAFSYFNGTRRDPIFSMDQAAATLRPHYVNSEYLAYDGVAFLSDWLLKAEAKIGREQNSNFQAWNIGVEYAFYPSPEFIQNVNWVAEWASDSRGNNAETMAQNDFFIGARATLGDIAQTDARLIWGRDLDYGSNYIDFSVSHRLTDYLRLEGKLIQFSNVGSKDQRLRLVENEDFVQFELHFSI